MTAQQQHAARITFVTVMLLSLLAFIYFKYIKPVLAKNKEDLRAAETDVIVKAQTPPILPTVTSPDGTVITVVDPTKPTDMVTPVFVAPVTYNPSTNPAPTGNTVVTTPAPTTTTPVTTTPVVSVNNGGGDSVTQYVQQVTASQNQQPTDSASASATASSTYSG